VANSNICTVRDRRVAAVAEQEAVVEREFEGFLKLLRSPYSTTLRQNLLKRMDAICGVLYFAYGSNLNRTQMKNRVSRIRPMGTAYLPDHELVFQQAQQGSVRQSQYSETPKGQRSLGRFV